MMFAGIDTFFKALASYDESRSSVLLTTYSTYIRKRMEYNCHVWASASISILRLVDHVQKRAKLFVNNGKGIQLYRCIGASLQCGLCFTVLLLLERILLK